MRYRPGTHRKVQARLTHEDHSLLTEIARENGSTPTGYATKRLQEIIEQHKRERRAPK